MSREFRVHFKKTLLVAVSGVLLAYACGKPGSTSNKPLNFAQITTLEQAETYAAALHDKNAKVKIAGGQYKLRIHTQIEESLDIDRMDFTGAPEGTPRRKPIHFQGKDEFRSEFKGKETVKRVKREYCDAQKRYSKYSSTFEVLKKPKRARGIGPGISAYATIQFDSDEADWRGASGDPLLYLQKVKDTSIFCPKGEYELFRNHENQATQLTAGAQVPFREHKLEGSYLKDVRRTYFLVRNGGRELRIISALKNTSSGEDGGEQFVVNDLTTHVFSESIYYWIPDGPKQAEVPAPVAPQPAQVEVEASEEAPELPQAPSEPASVPFSEGFDPHE